MSDNKKYFITISAEVMAASEKEAARKMSITLHDTINCNDDFIQNLHIEHIEEDMQ
jgi:hypothetical protein